MFKPSSSKKPPSFTKALWEHAAIIEFNTQREVTSVNAQFCAMLGYSAEELIGKKHHLLCPKNITEQPEYEPFWQDLLDGEPFIGQVERIKKDGSSIWLGAQYYPVKNRAGAVTRIVKIVRDVTSLATGSRDNRAIISAIERSMAIIEFDLEHKILRINDNFSQATGYTEEELIGQDHQIFCDPNYANSPAYQDFWQQLENGDYFTGLVPRRHKNGHTIWLEASYNPVSGTDGHVEKFIKTAFNATDRVERHQQEKQGTTAAFKKARSTRETAADGGRVINDAADQIKAIAEIFETTAEKTTALAAKTKEITQMIGTIQSISDQTNLLALNASVEAARAGEHGRGFAVVASEVRKLSQNTNQSAGLIRNIIQSIQQEVSTLSQSIESGQTSVSEGVKLAHQAGHAIEQINSHTQEVLETINKLSEELDLDQDY